MPRSRISIALALGLAAVTAALSAQQATIQSIQVNQGVGVQANGALKFVAGKDTVVRALLGGAVNVDPATTSAVVARDGTPVVTLSPNAYTGPVSAVDFLCPSLSACGDWAAGAYTFTVTVNGTTLSTAGTTYNFVPRAPVRILAVPVKANYNGVVVQVAGDRWKTMGGFTRDTYPVARAEFKWSTQQELDASDAKYNLETDAGRLELWQALTNLMPPHCANNPKAADCFDKIIGFVSDRPDGYPNGRLQGYTYGSPSNIVVAKDEDAAATVAHEVAHNYAAGDTYDGGSLRCAANPAPNGFSGKDWDDRAKTVSCSAGRVAFPGVSATLIPAATHLYEIGGRGLLGEMACYMGSGGLQAQFWTSPEVYDIIFDRSAPTPAAAMARPAAVQRFIEYFGMIRKDASSAADVEIEPWESYEEAFDEADTTGSYMVAAVDGAGRRLATSAIDVAFDIPGARGEETQNMTNAPFLGAMRFPSGTAAFQIISHGRVIRTLPVSPRAPVVTGVTPSSRMVLNGNYVIRWAATDADGDRLTYAVEYNRDTTKADSEWVPLADGIEDMFWEDDFSELGGGEHARIRIVASDGFNAGSAMSAEFSVPVKAPEVYIDELPIPFVQTGGQLALSSESWDAQDDVLADAQLSWTSSLDGNLGTGSSIVAKNLRAGMHVITLTGVNSVGLSDTATVSVLVGPGGTAGPPFGLMVTLPTGGTVRGAGINCGGGATACTVTVPGAINYGLQAVPASGFTFTRWTGDCTGTGPNLWLWLGGPRTCGAVFTATGAVAGATSDIR